MITSLQRVKIKPVTNSSHIARDGIFIQRKNRFLLLMTFQSSRPSDKFSLQLRELARRENGKQMQWIELQEFIMI